MGGKVKAVLRYVIEFCEISTIQGLNHVVAPRRHFAERILWILIVIFASLCAAALVMRSYRRYEDDPTVISMDKNYMAWTTQLPTATFCLVDRFDEDKATALIEKTWNTNDNDSIEYYTKFLKCISKGYYNIDEDAVDCNKFSKDPTLLEFDLAKLSEMVNFDMTGSYVVTSNGDENIGYHDTLIEAGHCYSTNISYLTHFFNSGTKRKNESQLNSVLINCTYFKPLCYAKVFMLTRAVKFYVHSAEDIPRISRALETKLDTDLYVDYLSQTIESTPRVKSLRPSQRKCLFYDEKPQGDVPFYTYNLCLLDCRRTLSVKLCGCVGYNYMQRDGQRQCGTKDLPCLLKHSELLETLKLQNKTRYPCNCLPDCTSTTYYQTSIKVRNSANRNKDMQPETAFRYGLESMPRTKLVRDVLYAAEDLLVSWGGIIGLFLGCSIISVVEVVYFFTIRVLRVLLVQPKEKRENISKLKIDRTTREWVRPYVFKHAGQRTKW